MPDAVASRKRGIQAGVFEALAEALTNNKARRRAEPAHPKRQTRHG
jgi:hypothetical protein